MFIWSSISSSLALALVREQLSSSEVFTVEHGLGGESSSLESQDRTSSHYVVSFMEQGMEFLTDESRLPIYFFYFFIYVFLIK